MTNYVLYTRTSTKSQNYGLEAQTIAAERYVNNINGLIIARFSEQESGKNDDRPLLKKAIQKCKETGSTLLIAKLDRLSRKVEFLFRLRSELELAGVGIVCADMPNVINNTLSLAIFAGLAQQERELISSRTKAALSTLRMKGIHLGNTKGVNLSKQREVATKVIKASADEWAAIHSPSVKALYGRGVSLNEIARIFNAEGKTTRRGGNFTATTIKRILERC